MLYTHIHKLNSIIFSFCLKIARRNEKKVSKDKLVIAEAQNWIDGTHILFFYFCLCLKHSIKTNKGKLKEDRDY